jgi:outer membrane protein assembly factor BamE (lipoprotein component of BamABCDE complex)
MENQIDMKKYLILLLLTVSCGKIEHTEFNSEKWKNSDLNTERDMSLRWDMMNSLRKNYDLIGMKKSEIIELLGQPTSVINNQFHYYLGFSKTGINTGTLYVTFDNKEVVSKIRVWQG